MNLVAAPTAALDIDGVVADPRHRLHWLDAPANWARFFEAADADPLLAEGHQLVQRLAAQHLIVWMTGRPERVRTATRNWLDEHQLPYDDLWMHPGDYATTTRQLKLQWCRQLATQRTLSVIVDDDPHVVKLLQDHHLPAQLATWCPYDARTGNDAHNP